MARKKAAAPKPAPAPVSVPTSGIPAHLRGVMGPTFTNVKHAQTMSNVSKIGAMRQMREQKTAANHSAMFGVGDGMMGMGGAMGGGGMGMNSSNYTNPYTHNFPVDILERPQSRQEQIEWNVRWYRENPIVRRVIDLHSQLPLSKMTITKPQSSSPAFSEYVHQFFLDMVRRISLFPKLRTNLGKGYWLHGDEFCFLEDQKLAPNDGPNADPYMDTPTETANQPSTNFFDVHKFVHKSSQQKWDKKYAAIASNPLLSLAPELMNKAMAGAPPRPKDYTISEEEVRDVFGVEAHTFLKMVHTIKDAAYELKKFADALNGIKTSNVRSINAAVINKLGPEFLSYPHHLAYVKTKNASKFKVAAEPAKVDEGPSDVDMALDPSKRPVFKLLGLDPINVQHIPRNDRTVSPTPNLDYQRFLQDNPDIQKAVSELPDPNNPVQINEPEEDVNVSVFGPDGVSPLDETGDLATPPPEGGDDSSGDLDLGGGAGGGGGLLPDLPEVAPEDDPQYQEELKLYNENLKRKKDLLEKIIEDLKGKAQDYICFSNVKYPNYKGWQAMRSLPPNQIEVARQSNSDHKQIFYIPSEQEAATIQANLQNLTEEAQDLWKTKKRLLLSSETQTGPSEKDKNLPADGSYIVQVSNARSDFELYGHGLVEPCLRDLIHDDKIAQVKSQTFARNMMPKRVVTADGVDETTIQKLQDMVDASTVDPDVSIVTNYAVTWQEIGIADRIQSYDSEYAHIMTNLTAGLAFFQEFITGQTTYGNSKTPQEIMNTMYLAFREDISFFIEESIFRPVAERKGFFDVNAFGQKYLIYPKVSFSRLAIRDAGDTFDMFLNLYLKGSISISKIYELLNVDEEEETQKLQDELFTIKDPKFTDLMTNIYQNVAQTIIERTNIAELLAKRMGLEYTAEDDGASEEGGGGMPPL